MSLLDRLANGWNLMKASFAVIGANPRLLLFPAATAVLTIVIGFLFMTPIVLQPSGHKYSEGAHWAEVGSRLIVTSAPDEYDLLRGRKQHVEVSRQLMAYMVLGYFLSMFFATFFNVAFTHEIFDALDGKSVSVGEGIQFALTKVKPILMWTLFAGLIGILIKSLEERFGIFGRWVIRTVGFAWSVASVFVIPVLVLEEHSNNPIEVVRQSASVIRKTWGEALAGYAGLQLGGFLIGFSLFVAIIASGVGAYMTQSAWPVAVGLLGWLMAAIAFSYTLGVAGQVYLCVLYRYATAGTVPAGYTAEMLGMAWTPKKA
ncbi:MAG: hypothetical protein HY923_05255 [Elusimicrobia bacterium]|nr:hypothetical protein [Elusimicrobiota bacterium]